MLIQNLKDILVYLNVLPNVKDKYVSLTEQEKIAKDIADATTYETLAAATFGGNAEGNAILPVVLTGAYTTGVDIGGTYSTGILFRGTGDKGINFAAVAPDFGSQEDAYIAIGTYTSAVTIADTGASFIPIQVNLSSTGDTAAAGSQVACARLRVDSDTNNQANTALSCLQLRSDISTNVYASTCISASLNVSANVSLPTATMQGIYIAITGAGAITCPNNVNVFEAVYKQTTGGGGVDNVAELACNASECSLTNILEVINYAGTVTNGIYMSGAVATGISIASTYTTGIELSGDGTTAISVTSGFSGANMLSLAGTGSNAGILISGACAIGLSITGVMSDYIKTAMSGTLTAAATTNGVNVVSTNTLNGGSVNFNAMNIDMSGMTLTSCNNVYGLKIVTKAGVDGAVYATDGTYSAYLCDGTWAAYLTGGIYLGASTTGISMAGAMTTGISITGANTTPIAISNTFSGNGIDFSGCTYVPTGSAGTALIRAGTYNTPLANSVTDQSGLIRLYMQTSADGSSYDRAIFSCLKTTGTKGIITTAGLAEVLADATGPANVKGCEFIADLHETGSNLPASAIMYGGWFKVTAIDGATINATAKVAPLWLDNQLYGANAVGCLEYTIWNTTGGTVPKAWAGFGTTSAGWAQLLYFDATMATVAPFVATGCTITAAEMVVPYLKVLVNTTQYGIPLIAI